MYTRKIYMMTRQHETLYQLLQEDPCTPSVLSRSLLCFEGRSVQPRRMARFVHFLARFLSCSKACETPSLFA